MLADTGPEVIKIETAEGETMRTRRPLRNSCSTAFGQLNVGKNSTLSELQSSQFELKATQRPMFGPIATSKMERDLQGFQPAVPHVGRESFGGPAHFDARRTYACLSQGDRILRRRDRGLRG
jgi:hypothetical protein